MRKLDNAVEVPEPSGIGGSRGSGGPRRVLVLALSPGGHFRYTTIFGSSPGGRFRYTKIVCFYRCSKDDLKMLSRCFKEFVKSF